MSNIIDKIQLSGVTYTIGGQGGSGVSVVEVTQAEYDALPSSAKTDTSKMYVITDAEAGDLSQYWTSAQTTSAIAQAVSGKTDNSDFTGHTADTTVHVTAQDKTNWNAKSNFSGSYNDLTNKLSAGTGISIVDNVISAEGGGGVNVVQTTGTSTTDVMSQDAVTSQLKTKLDNVRVEPKTPTSNYTQLNLYLQKENGGGQSLFTYVKTINGKSITSQNNDNLEGFSLVETSAITTSVTSSSTDAQVPSAKAVNDKLGGLSLVKLTQAEYDALATKDSNTLYVIVN